MKVFILLSVIAVAFASHQCGENQHYESCGTACPLTCENYDNPPVACILMCNPGCHCDKGYVKTDDGRCVKPEECPARAEQVCGENERYYGCGTACPLTCDNYANPPKICNLMCVVGCQCEKGFVRARDGRCVRPEECPAQAPAEKKSCLDKPDSGMCDAYIPMWYYDVKSGICQTFVYGGCGGNGNRYETERDCKLHCGAYGAESNADLCELPAESGPCFAYFRRFYFDKATGQCKKFVYGGCRGNKNNFKTVEDCNQACGAQPAQSSANRCELPAKTGPCRAFFRRFHFNKATGQCQAFVYGGCKGNENNFRTAEECNQACGVQAADDVCSLPAEVGMCRGYFPRYYYNEKTGRCQKFIYGGCGSNGNNFETVEECNKACSKS